jgi:hypothetical protein
MKYVLNILFLLIFAALEVFASNLLSGLEESSSFVRTILCPALSTVGFIIAGVVFIFGEGNEAKKKAWNITIGSILIFIAPWIPQMLRSWFGG